MKGTFYTTAGILFCASTFLSFSPTCIRGAEPTATPVERLKLLPGFKAELLYSVPGQQQGSWVSLTVDDRGRLITSDQYGKLYRITLPSKGADTNEIEISPINVDLGMAQGLLYAFDSLYVVVNGKGPGLYRVTDKDGDDQFDTVKLLRAFEGSSEHGPHAVILGPDKKSLYVCAGNHTNLPPVEKSLVPRNWQEDLLLERMWDARGHAAGKLAPGGWICRTDPEGKEFELVANGFRNEYDIALNPEGELFSYDADMEWDVGTPWYRPTRVVHVTSGAEFGWRSGTGKWPAYYPDSLPPVVNVGPGSPTGIVFGTGAKFPAKYQRALFIADWSYGTIYAVHLTPKGATYQGKLERFVSAAPLPVTDMLIHPNDGALYFTIGGRRTQSGLYRITYVGDESTATVSANSMAGQEARDIRRELEALHGAAHEGAVDKAWPALSNEDRFIRYAARIAIEHQPVKSWQQRALEEANPQALITAMVALARNGDKSLQPRIVKALAALDWSSLDRNLKLDLLRAYALAFTRMGKPSDSTRQTVLDHVNSHFPAKNQFLNRELSRLLAYLEAPNVVRRTLDLLAVAPTQEEQIHYAFVLRNVKTGWTIDDRRAYFRWFNAAAAHRGGASFGGFLRNIRDAAIANLTAKEKKELAKLLAEKPKPRDPVAAKSRPFVKKWTAEDLLPEIDAGLDGRNFVRGRSMFAAASCFKCHRFDGQGGAVGPDLTAVGTRFSWRDLLDSVIHPSKTISDQYQSTMYLLEDGRVVTGRVVNLNKNTLRIMTDMLDPGNLTIINREQIEVQKPSPTSQMPEGLLDTLSKQEILDLLAYLRSGGNPDHEFFR